jgi:hypothetical protein
MDKKTVTLVDIYNRDDDLYNQNNKIYTQAQRSKKEVSLDKDAFIKAINKHSDILRSCSF